MQLSKYGSRPRAKAANPRHPCKSHEGSRWEMDKDAYRIVGQARDANSASRLDSSVDQRAKEVGKSLAA